jgi:hypothetical protein
MAVRQDINVGLLGFVGIVGTMLLAISIWGLEAWYAYEVDLLRQVRFQENRNLTWTQIRDEQYANIGDTVGNATVYAAAETGGEAMGPAAGYRFPTRERDVAVIPIHAAMAQIASQFGKEPVTAAQMREMDQKPVATANRAYEEFMTPVPPPQTESGATLPH